MSKKTTLIIVLQVVVLSVFVGMALACKSTGTVAPKVKTERDDRGACGNPEYVFMGRYDNFTACSAACNAAGLSSPCLSAGNCFCK